jgi:hypothetical protein
MSYEDWVEYCFTYARDDWSDDAPGSDPDRLATAESLPPPTIAEYLVRLMENSSGLEKRFTPEQIGKAVWYLFGIGSSYFHHIQSKEVAPELQVRVYSSIPRIYIDLFDKVCNRDAEETDDLSNTDPLDGAVYMIWDMDVLRGPLMTPGGGSYYQPPSSTPDPDLRVPGYKSLETILLKCITPTCLKSALHGLGHLEMYNASEVHRIIDGFLKKRGPHLPAWLTDYASYARDGRVQ